MPARNFHLSIRTKLSALLAILFLGAIGNSLFTFQMEKYGDEKPAWVTHTHEVLRLTEQLLSDMKDAETGQRGYLLTMDTSYLKSYHNGLNSAKEHFASLQKLTADNQEQQHRLELIGTEMKLKFEELAETIGLAQDGRHQQAIIIVRANRGLQHMETIRELFNEFTHAELILLETRKGEYRTHKAEISTLVIVEMAFFIFFAVLTLTFLQKNFFRPIQLLLDSAEKIKEGKSLEAQDVIEKDEMGNLLATFMSMSAKIQERTENLEFEARHDELTGLKNRSTLNDELLVALEECEANNTKVAVLFLDLDKFKPINDELGHDVGDIILKKTAERILAAVRSEDQVFRIGGDEFLVLSQHVHDQTDIEKIAGKVVEAFNEPVQVKGESIDYSISLGISIYPDHTRDPLKVLTYADIAMYAAKKDHMLRYKFFDGSMLKRAEDQR